MKASNFDLDLIKQILIDNLVSAITDQIKWDSDPRTLEQHITYIMEAIELSKALVHHKSPLFRYAQEHNQIEANELGHKLYKLLKWFDSIWGTQGDSIFSYCNARYWHSYVACWLVDGPRIFKRCLEQYMDEHLKLALDKLKQQQPEKLVKALNQFTQDIRQELINKKAQIKNHQDSVRQNYRRLTTYIQKLCRHYKELRMISFTMRHANNSHYQKSIKTLLMELLSQLKKEDIRRNALLGYVWKLKAIELKNRTVEEYMEVLLIFEDNGYRQCPEQLLRSFVQGVSFKKRQNIHINKQIPYKKNQRLERIILSLTITDEYFYYKPENVKTKTFAKTSYKSKPRKKEGHNVKYIY